MARQLGMVRSKLGSQGLPKVRNDGAQGQAVLPAMSLPRSGGWAVTAEHIWAALGGSGSIPGPAQVMGIGMGQDCWGIKGSSRLTGIF